MLSRIVGVRERIKGKENGLQTEVSVSGKVSICGEKKMVCKQNCQCQGRYQFVGRRKWFANRIVSVRERNTINLWGKENGLQTELSVSGNVILSICGAKKLVCKQNNSYCQHQQCSLFSVWVCTVMCISISPAILSVFVVFAQFANSATTDT